MSINKIESALKRYLKGKIGYSLSLLVVFLISGELSLGDSLNKIQLGRKELLEKIKIEKKRIKEKIDENLKEIKKIDENQYELVKKADWYSKGTFESTQLEMIFSKKNSGKLKNRTEKEFEKTLNAVKKEKGKNLNNTELIDTKGVVVDNRRHTLTLDVGVNIKPLVPELPTINPDLSINISAPVVDIGLLPGAPAINIPQIVSPTAPNVFSITQPNEVAMNVTAPKEIEKIEVVAPTSTIIAATPIININPVTVNASLNVKTPDSIISPAPREPNRALNIVEPDANPFSDFSWEWMSSNSPKANTQSSSSSDLSLGDNINVTGGIFWSGVKTDGTIADTAGYTNATQTTYNGQTDSEFDGSRNYDKRHLSIINSYNGRWTGKPGNVITGGTFYIAGNVNGISDNARATGTEAFHLVGDVHLKNVTANLYGKAAFINAEAFRGGQTTMEDVTINVLRDENTVFHLKGHSPGQEDKTFAGSQFATKFAGNANITINTKKNSVYAVRNFAGGLKIENTGKIVFNGASNIGVSFLTWVPDKSKYITTSGAGILGEQSIDDYIPYVKLNSATPIEMYGDENVGIFFNKKISGYDVGIHQGYFNLYFNIGTKLSSLNGVTQIIEGQLGKDGYTATTVDGNVGVYAVSGQRTGVDITNLASQSYFKNDPIHNLIMDNFDIKFGKYSKNGFMFLAKNGTVIDIQGIKTTSFSDGINGTSTAEVDTGMGTVIAFAEGNWTSAGTLLTGNALEGKPTEIIVDKKLNMMSKEGIAFFAKDGGLITVKKAVEAYGYSSIIGYADNGTIIINADIKAIDSGVVTENKKYDNIGGYAIANGTITVTGNTEVNGLGAFANGANAKVYLKGEQNKIKTGISGGLASLNGGYVEFGGGIIEHKNITQGDHDQKLPFFADDTSKINFTGTTKIIMYNGAVFSGNTNDYSGTAGTSTKYNGMENVTISLQANGINLGVFKNQNIIWNGENSYLEHLATIPKVAAIEENGHWYNSYLEGGKIEINQNIDLDAKSIGITKGGDAFNDIGMEREQITINSGVKITSINGNGLVLGSNTTANTNGKNTDSGYVNNGEIEISGGNQTGIYVSYGHVKNNNLINTDGGNGVLGVNGSKIENTGRIIIGIPTTVNGIGIVGLATKIKADGNPATPESYGTDGGDTITKVLEISNTNIISVNGISGIGISAINNVNLAGNNRAFVENTGRISVGDSSEISSSVGIYGEKVTISNLGTVSVGDNAVAIYAAKGSNITDLGTLDLGRDSTGVYVTGDTDIVATTVTLTSNKEDVRGKTGVFYKGTGIENKIINLAIDASRFDNGVVLAIENMNIESQNLIKVGKAGIGIYTTGESTKIAKNTGTINLTDENAIGMYTKSTTLDNAGTINITDATQLGIYAGISGKITNTGTINLGVDSSTGIFVKDRATVELEGDNIIFNGKSSVGIFADNAKVLITDDASLTNSNENKNILVYAKGSQVDITAGKIIEIDGVGSATTSGNKTVGIYLENVVANNTFNGAGTLKVKNEAIGIYSKGNNILNVNVVATGEKTTGIFVDGSSKITGSIEANGTATGGAIGVYGTGGVIDATGGVNLNTTTGKGTGMYLVDGATVTGTVNVKNTSSEKNIGVYYSKGTATADVTNSAKINILENNSIGLYAADGIKLINNGNIESIAGKEKNIGSFVGNNAHLISNGNITLNDNDSIGLYVQHGIGENNGVIELNGTATLGNSIVGLVAEASTGKTAAIKNTGTVKAKSNLGMYVAGTGINAGENTGTIDTTGVAGEGTGVYVNGATNSFNGIGGTIKSDGVGIYLKDTIAGKIETGKLVLGAGAVGIFADNSIIDFTVDTTNSTADGVVGIAAKRNSTILGSIKTGQNSIGVYLLDDTVTFNGATVETGASSGATSIGILLDDSITAYTLRNVSINAKNGVGLYLNELSSGTRNITYSATITTKDGIGIFVDKGNILDNSGGVINVDGGVGIYIAPDGVANLGITDTLAFNFLSDGGIGIFNAGGILNIGDNIAVTGTGSLAVTKNGDLTSSGRLSIGEGGTGLLGEYDSATNSPKIILNTGTIVAHTGGKGLAAIKGGSPPTGLVTVKNSGVITVSGESATNEPSIGIYTDVAAVDNSIGTINVGDKGIGIFVNNTGQAVDAGTINLTGTDGIGVYIKGSIGTFTGNSIRGTGIGIIYEGDAPTLSIGTIALGNGSKGIIMSGTGVPALGSTILTGDITVGDSIPNKTAIGVAVQKGANVTFANTTKITSGKEGVGVYAKEATISDINLNNITVGENGIYIYGENSDITLLAGNFRVDGVTGIYAKGLSTVNTSGASTLTVLNGGLGVYLEDGATASLGDITVQSGLGNGKQSIGIYYKDMTGSITLSEVAQNGNYTIGSVLENTVGVVGNISLTSASNSVGIALKGDSTLTTGNLTINGNKNIGIYSSGGKSIINGNIDVFESVYSNDKSLSSIGVFTKDGTIRVNGNISVRDNSIGVYGERVDEVFANGDIVVGENGLGVYASGKSRTSTLNITGTYQIAANNTIGIFGENINTTVSGDFIIKEGTSIGVVSKGTGDVSTTGNMTIGESSIGIYKIDGSGDITVGLGTITVDKKGYGIYLTETSGTVKNNSDMVLGESAIGIYSKGVNVIENHGTITVGKTNFGPNNNPAETANHLNSVGIFMSEGTTAKNIGTINVTETLSVGVYGDGIGNSFENIGTMNIDNGGVGILVKNGATAINKGEINIGGTVNDAEHSIGMAAYTGSTIVNDTSGVINVTEGIGMLVGTGGILENKGTINIVNGTGIYGDGVIRNSGTITVTGSGISISDGTVTSTGGVQIDKDGKVTINGSYASIGGTLIVDGSLDINGAFVDITTGKPVFKADNITGNVNILPNFALTGNGYTYEVKGFLSTLSDSMKGSKVTPILSPLWVADIDRDGNLIIVKKPYADLTIGNQFDNLDKGLDNILMGDGNSSDKDILKKINHYLSGLSEEDYAKEAGRVLGETRGDAYATIQTRMNTINDAFNSSFNDLEKLYNKTKDSNKYGVIYSTGDFKDPTVGIDDYKYNITGLMYVHENEQVEYKSKFGYSLGFAVSKFDFDDDAKSKENVYSLRAGVHRTNLLENGLEWGTQLNATYNYHKADRKMALGYGTVKNKSNYNTYLLEVNNKLTKELYGDYVKNVKAYTGLHLGYGVLNSFKEKGNLILEVKSNDYYSIKPEIGTSSEYKFYAGKSREVVLFGNIGLNYELGEVFDGNKARLKDGGEGYYSLITPEKEKGSLVFKVGTKFEQFNKFDVIFESEGVIAENKDDIDMKYSIKFNYIF